MEELERRIENLVNGIGGFEGIAGAGSGVKKDAGVGEKGLGRGTSAGGEQRARIEDVLNSPAEMGASGESCPGSGNARENYCGPPAQKRSRLASTSEVPGMSNSNIYQHQADSSAPSTITRAAYTPVSPSTATPPTTSANSTYAPRYNDSPTQQPHPQYDPTPPPRPRNPPNSSSPPYRDVIDQGHISLSLATLLYNHFTVELLPHTPFLVLPPFFTSSTCRTCRPTLFLAILVGTIQRPPAALAESVSNDANGNALIDELHWMFADKTMYRGEKSLEIVQALLVACNWYTTPLESGVIAIVEKHKGFMWVSQAISMCLELGLARPGSGLRCLPPSASSSASGKSGLSAQHSIEETEGRRAALGCYWMSVNVCMIIKRPHLMKWTSPLNDALEVLQKGCREDGGSGKSADRILVEMVRAARIVEESGFTGCYETFHELMGNGALKIARVKFIITALERQVEDWWGKVPEGVKYHNSISLTYHALQIYIHEICLHSETGQSPYSGGLGAATHTSSIYGPDASFLKPPFLSDHVLKNKFGRFFAWGSLPTMSPALTSSYLPVIIKSAHNLLDTFLALGKGTIDFLPHIAFGRVCYAILVLVKIDRLFNAAGGEVVGGEELKLGWYLERVLVAFGKDVVKSRGGGICAGPRTCLGRLFRNMKGWWDRQVKVGGGGSGGECSAGAGGEGGGECVRMRGLFNCGGGEGSAGGCGGAAAAVGGSNNPSSNGGSVHQDAASYLTPSSSADQPTPGAVGSYQEQQTQQQQDSYPGIGGTGAVLGQDEFMQLGLGGWTLTDEDWIALMNAGGNGLQLFDY